MKKLKKSFLLLLSAAVIGFSGCEKTDDPYKPAPATSGGSNTSQTGTTAHLKMKVEGHNYEARTMSYSTYYQNGLPVSLLTATSTLQSQAPLTIKLVLEKGEYTFGHQEDPVYAKYGDAFSTNGKLIITAVDKTNKRVSGTFSFATDNAAITEGNFLNVPMR